MTYNGLTAVTDLLSFYNGLFNPRLVQGPDLTPLGPQNFIPKSIWAYQQLVNMINEAIAFTHSLVNPAGKAPYMTYSDVSQTYSVIADNSYIEPSPYNLPLVEKLFFSNNLFNLFSNFFGLRDDYFPPGYFQFVFQNTFNNNITTRDSLAGVEMKQEYPTLYLQSSLKNLVITSNSFPVNAEEQFISSITNDSFSGLSKNILTDFEVSYANQRVAGDSRSVEQYQAQIYRFIDLKGTSELRNFVLSIYGYFPDQPDEFKYVKLFLQPRATVTIKILFKRKKINY